MLYVAWNMEQVKTVSKTVKEEPVVSMKSDIVAQEKMTDKIN